MTTAHDHGHEQAHDHGHVDGSGIAGDPTAVRFTEEFWEERYGSRPSVWSGRPNPHLVGEVGALRPGRAVDVGCGEGADAIWLARQGWQVLALDWSRTALDRGRRAAEQVGAEVAARISWRHQDLVTWQPEPDSADLVNSQFLHLPPGQLMPLFGRLAGAVRPGGTLLIVGHHVSDLETTMPRPHVPELFFSGDDLTALLDPAAWDVRADGAVPRSATDPDGREITIRDTVFRAVRRPL
ncbi:SAM-dependent methyltransferase [Friedmanniella endophytica]|uniref:SAM-dependent methyltransferase n=1 Tax=Microlunatus kandeliicorticis TaxID=1759536 RepID=A0A7W3IT40_9ACTN|nr:class I SAM-dependent methyltransferase [Microlunatus kandeliicorticis]MBA8794736.1 SAM-dependent methyltransferase [Microlunatus kandeliicorticis]